MRHFTALLLAVALAIGSAQAVELNNALGTVNGVKYSAGHVVKGAGVNAERRDVNVNSALGSADNLVKGVNAARRDVDVNSALGTADNLVKGAGVDAAKRNSLVDANALNENNIVALGNDNDQTQQRRQLANADLLNCNNIAALGDANKQGGCKSDSGIPDVPGKHGHPGAEHQYLGQRQLLNVEALNHNNIAAGSSNQQTQNKRSNGEILNVNALNHNNIVALGDENSQHQAKRFVAAPLVDVKALDNNNIAALGSDNEQSQQQEGADANQKYRRHQMKRFGNAPY